MNELLSFGQCEPTQTPPVIRVVNGTPIVARSQAALDAHELAVRRWQTTGLTGETIATEGSPHA